MRAEQQLRGFKRAEEEANSQVSDVPILPQLAVCVEKIVFLSAIRSSLDTCPMT